jgi:predicted DNA-binding WGR domain protein
MTNKMKKNFEYKDVKSSKFWEITQLGSTVTVRYGKTGTNGQSQDKVFDDAQSANKHVAKLISEKTGKGYVEVGDTLSNRGKAVNTSDTSHTPADLPVTKTKVQKVRSNKTEKSKNPAQDPEAKPESLMALLDKDDATNRLLAKHPRASGELLEKLSHSSDKATRKGVAGNPNTAPEILVKLGQQFPEEFLSNPALDLLLMINPGLMEEVPQALLTRLLKHADCPASLLNWGAGHPHIKVQLAVAMNAKAPEEALVKLRASHHSPVLEAVNASRSSASLQDPEKAFEQAVIDRLNALTIPELTDAWMGFDIGLAQWPYLPLAFRLSIANGGPPDWDSVIAKIVKTTWTPEVILKLIGVESAGPCLVRDSGIPQSMRDAVLESLAKDSDESRRRIAAINPSTPVEALEVLAKDSVTFVRRTVAENPATSITALETLAEDWNSSVRSGVASNPAVTETILEALAKDTDSSVRCSVAEHPLLSASVLEAMANDTDHWVRAHIARHPTTPVSVLVALADDNDGVVLCSVAENPSTPFDVCESIWQKLVNDKSVKLRSHLAGQRSTPATILEALAHDKDTEVRRSVAKNLSAPLAILEALAKDTEFWVRDNVAENPSTPVASLSSLAKDSSAMGMVRRSVAANPTTPVVVLEELAKDKDCGVRCGVAKNLTTPVPVLESLAKDTDSAVRGEVALNPSTPATTLMVLAKDKDSGVRRCISENPKSPPDLLEKLASDKNVEVLFGIAENPNTPVPVLLRLCDSKFEAVREALAGHAHHSAQILQTLRKDPCEDVRLAVLRNQELDQATLDELAFDIVLEKDALAMLEHPNLSTKSAQIIADKLFTAVPTDSPWYRRELSKASAAVQAAVKGNMVLSFSGNDPNKAVLEKRALAAVMALCAGPFIEPNRIVKVAGSTDWLVRAAVARNPGTPPNLLKKLSADAHPLVSGLIAFRYACDANAMSKIGFSDADPGAFALGRVVEEILRRMRADGQGWACVPLVNCKNWSDHANINDFLSWLKRFEFFDEVVGLFIRDLEDSHKDFFWQLVTQLKDGEVRMRLVKSHVVPDETLEKLVLSEFVDVLLVIAGRPDVSNDLKLKAEKAAIRLIAKRGVPYRKMIARNYIYLTVAIRERLAKDKDWYVKYEINHAQNSMYPEWMYQSKVLSNDDGLSELKVDGSEGGLEVGHGFLHNAGNHQVSDLLDQLRTVFQREIKVREGIYAFTTGNITSDDVFNAILWLGYVPATDKVAPTKSARSTDWLTRLGAALHPGASQGILKLLKDDVDPSVAQAVRMREIAIEGASETANPSS